MSSGSAVFGWRNTWFYLLPPGGVKLKWTPHVNCGQLAGWLSYKGCDCVFQMTSPDDADDRDDRSNYTSLDDIDRSLPSLHSPCCRAASPDETVCSDNSRRPLCAHSNPHVPSSEQPYTAAPSEGGTSDCDSGEDVWLHRSDANSESRESKGTSGSCGAPVQV